MSKKVVPLLTAEASLKRSIRRALLSSGFRTVNGELVGEASSKERIRALHLTQRKAKLASSARVLSLWPKFSTYFACGNDIAPEKIQPRLELIDSKSWQSDLFALATLNWSVPTSNGYGRRLRFLCWDDNNGKLIGLIALADPVFNLRVRDQYIGWTGEDRIRRLSCAMDAYVLGALPPYNSLLAGKMLACFLKSSDIFHTFRNKYSSYRAVISGKRHRPELAVVTTSSALGRSSVYNRLKLRDELYLKSIGETRGYGHFHIPDRVFAQMRKYLTSIGHEYANGHSFGQGANWRMRVIRETFKQLGLSPLLLKHGVAREVFIAETASNSASYLRGETKSLEVAGIASVSEISRLALDRWIIPRAARLPGFIDWQLDDTLHAFQSSYGVQSHNPKLQAFSASGTE